MRRLSLLLLVLASGLTLALAAPPGRSPASDRILAGRWEWAVSPPLVSPAARPDDPCFSVKDPSVVFFGGRWHLFCTIRSQKRARQIEYRSFADWKEADRATPHVLKLTEKDFCAPQVFYFSPQKRWYLVYQVVDNARRPNHYPVYSTSTNLVDPRSWTKPVELFPRHPENVREWIDFWVICDATRAHLFFTSLDGRMWRSETRKEDFPAKWSKPAVALRGDFFEASHTYRLRGLGKYLTLVEALDGTNSATCRRYYQAYLADRLDGPWRPVAASKERPFAGPANTRHAGAAWADSFSHGEIPWRLGLLEPVKAKSAGLDSDFFIKPADVRRRLLRPDGERRLAFANHKGKFEPWRKRCKEKLAELLNVAPPTRPCPVKVVREARFQGVRIQALVMDVSDDLAIPAYLLFPAKPKAPGTAVIAIHGHGDIEPCIGERDEYHHMFALKLAQAGHLVLCPEVRGFGVLNDMAADRPGHRLDYWNRARRVNDRQFTLVTDAIIKGQTLVGESVGDLLRWEDYLALSHGVKSVRVTGLSYGGDLALTYPVFSARVERIFASGTFGSFTPIFARCYNAPAHCVPNVLRWMDRADIAGLNAPRPIALHYGELDTPSKDNYSAAYNETVAPALRELRAVYAAAGAKGKVQLIVSKGRGHEMDIEALLAFMR
jgi:dienelactone hydrolase